MHRVSGEKGGDRRALVLHLLHDGDVFDDVTQHLPLFPVDQPLQTVTSRHIVVEKCRRAADLHGVRVALVDERDVAEVPNQGTTYNQVATEMLKPGEGHEHAEKRDNRRRRAAVNCTQRIIVIVSTVLLRKPGVIRIFLLPHTVPCMLQPGASALQIEIEWLNITCLNTLLLCNADRICITPL